MKTKLEQAFQIIDSVCASVRVTRADHVEIANALSIIKEATKPVKGKPNDRNNESEPK